MLRNTLMFSLILSLFTMLACDPEEELKKKLEGELGGQLNKGFGIKSMVLANKFGGTEHKVEEGDTITITFNEEVHADFTVDKFNVDFATNLTRDNNGVDYYEVTIAKKSDGGVSSVAIVKFRINRQPFTGYNGIFSDSASSWNEDKTVLTIALGKLLDPKDQIAQNMDSPVYSEAYALASLKNKEGKSANVLIKSVKPSGGF